MDQSCCITQPPSDLENDKKSFKKQESTWQKRYMINLNTLNTEELWLKKLENISAESLTGLLKALGKKQVYPRMYNQGKY